MSDNMLVIASHAPAPPFPLLTPFSPPSPPLPPPLLPDACLPAPLPIITSAQPSTEGHHQSPDPTFHQPIFFSRPSATILSLSPDAGEGEGGGCSFSSFSVRHRRNLYDRSPCSAWQPFRNIQIQIQIHNALAHMLQLLFSFAYFLHLSCIERIPSFSFRRQLSDVYPDGVMNLLHSYWHN